MRLSVQSDLNMKFLVSLALLGLAAARNLQDVRIDSLEYGFCGKPAWNLYMP